MRLRKELWYDRVPRSGADRAWEALAAQLRMGREAMLVDDRPRQREPEPEAEGRNRRFWVRTHEGECPACGRDVSRKERVYDEPPPEDPYDRIVRLAGGETHCGCEGHDTTVVSTGEY